MLALIGETLGDESVSKPELTALAEGAAPAVHLFIHHELTAEIDMVGERGPDKAPNSWRTRILTAFTEAEGEAETVACRVRLPESGRRDGDEDSSSLPAADSDDLVDCESLFVFPTARLIWDEDYEVEEEFGDADPEEAATLKRVMRIGDG